jgi:hypothetical protein
VKTAGNMLTALPLEKFVKQMNVAKLKVLIDNVKTKASSSNMTVNLLF